jgi:hypothetical protein
VFFQANPDSGAGEFSMSVISRGNFFLVLAGAEDAEVSDAEISLTLILSYPLEYLNCIHLSCHGC